MSFNTSVANSTISNSTSGIGSNLTSNLTSNSSGIATNSRLVHSNVVAPSSVTASSLSGFNTSSVSPSSSSTPAVDDGSKVKNGAAAGIVANPLSWKYGVALGAVMVGSFVLGSGL
ncbi:hypothetical protein ZYGR_0AF02990 [Zygosaccharomyces rouxii]|uniref:Uncharacterized protein n=1 Tax=Zygosaccharomyces rouxii TaxID=4956 RepID=A0A1Q3A840_ZYGRO|nr:hypothetical protein ZYGR_0AF02990 [Zygosaccharomyces rouxii]